MSYEYVEFALLLVLALGILSLLLVTGLHLRNYARLVKCLEQKMPNQWNDLGKPGIVTASPSNILKVFGWLRKRNEWVYSACVDEANRTTISLYLAALLFAAVVSLFLLWILLLTVPFAK
jgi:hypothetical protein